MSNPKSDINVLNIPVSTSIRTKKLIYMLIEAGMENKKAMTQLHITEEDADNITTALEPLWHELAIHAVMNSTHHNAPIKSLDEMKKCIHDL